MNNLENVINSDADQWLEQAAFLSAGAGLDYIDVIIDLAGSGRSAKEMFHNVIPDIRLASLFEGMPEEGLKDEGPILVRFLWAEWQHKTFLAELMRYWGDASRLMLLISPLVFDEVKSQLLALSRFEWGKQSGIFRFYDSRIFPALFSHVLSDEQQSAFNRLAYYWGWQDRDGCQIWKQGSIGPDSTMLPPPIILRLDDRQIEAIGCISDADMLARALSQNTLSREACFSRCFDAALAAGQEGFWGDLSEYVQRYEWACGGSDINMSGPVDE